MSEAHNLPVTPSADALARVMVRALIVGKPIAKMARVCRRLQAIADDMEASALASANIYPINGGGRPYGGRPADLERRAAARALRDAMIAEVPAAISGGPHHSRL